MEEFIVLPRQQLARVKDLCSQVGLNFVDPPEQFMGVGVAVPFGQTGYVVLSVMGGGMENQAHDHQRDPQRHPTGPPGRAQRMQPLQRLEHGLPALPR